MRVINASYKILTPDLDDPSTASDIYGKIERAGRVCYKSEDRITKDSGEKFVRAMVKNGHEAMLEHASMSVLFTVDRGVSHELVRHRLCSFAQESTRFCRYSKDKFGGEITVILPYFLRNLSEEHRLMLLDIFYGKVDLKEDWKPTPSEIFYARWYDACSTAEREYINLLDLGCTPEEARTVLPMSLKTDIVMTANMREWRQIFKLRAAGEYGKPHPQMLEVMVPLLNECKMKLPALFEDITAMEE